jgi:hypothetical protein
MSSLKTLHPPPHSVAMPCPSFPANQFVQYLKKYGPFCSFLKGNFLRLNDFKIAIIYFNCNFSPILAGKFYQELATPTGSHN